MIATENCFSSQLENKESKLRLNIEIRTTDDVTVISCTGRIVYRDEAVELSEKIAGLLPSTRQLIIELSGVEIIDSAGLGELALMLTWARAMGCAIKLAAPSDRVQHLLELTNLASVFEIHPTLETALLGFSEQPV
jgi:anti-sigma B factor antagonist